MIALIDVIHVVTFGAVAARTLIGPAFWGAHLIVFLFAAPALANVLIMTRKGMWFRRWYATAAVCCVFGVFLVFFQVGVGDALYGPDGVGGPFSP
jgi:glucan phosphoethanolaminetransferase (alkaline phosphatase superfamily)